jgi:hypothetical protein
MPAAPVDPMPAAPVDLALAEPENPAPIPGLSADPPSIPCAPEDPMPDCRAELPEPPDIPPPLWPRFLVMTLPPRPRPEDPERGLRPIQCLVEWRNGDSVRVRASTRSAVVAAGLCA